MYTKGPNDMEFTKGPKEMEHGIQILKLSCQAKGSSKEGSIPKRQSGSFRENSPWKTFLSLTTSSIEER
nr:hypothetical protein [Tanacetum cinerariifolium]